MSQININAQDINTTLKKFFPGICFQDGKIMLDFGDLKGHLSETQISSKFNLDYNGLAVISDGAKLTATGLTIDFKIKGE